MDPHPGWAKVDPGHPGARLIDLSKILTGGFLTQVAPGPETRVADDPLARPGVTFLGRAVAAFFGRSPRTGGTSA